MVAKKCLKDNFYKEYVATEIFSREVGRDLQL